MQKKSLKYADFESYCLTENKLRYEVAQRFDAFAFRSKTRV